MIIMNRSAILIELKKVLGPYTENKGMLDEISEKTDLIMDLKINSANLVDIIIDAESAEKMYKVGNIIDVITDKMSKTA
jgi:acyl carrier protein